MVTIRTMLPDTNFQMPTDQELKTLARIALSAHADLKENADRMPDFAEQFRRAFYAVGFQFRLDQPTPKFYFHAHLEAANTFLRQQGNASVDGAPFLAAVFAHNDICWQQADESAGQLLLLGLDPYSGRRCSNAWRDLLRGGNMLAPTPAPRHLRPPEPTSVRMYQEDAGGVMRPVDARWR
jgi:hypothetical protein